MAGRQKYVFFYLLRQDTDGSLEEVCSLLCRTPQQLYAAREMFYNTKSVVVSRGACGFNPLKYAVINLAKDCGYEGQLERDGYCEEASNLLELGRIHDGLKFVGRALEASAILYAVDQFLKTHGLSAEDVALPSAKLQQLVASPKHEILSEIADHMLAYKDLFLQRVRKDMHIVSQLKALLQVEPKVYRVMSKVMQASSQAADKKPSAEERLSHLHPSFKLHPDSDSWEDRLFKRIASCTSPTFEAKDREWGFDVKIQHTQAA